MALTFGALLYFQIMYLERMVKMREAQFTEGVRRAMYNTAGFLERQETLHFLEQDVMALEDSFYDDYEEGPSTVSPRDSNLFLQSAAAGAGKTQLIFQSPTQRITDRYSRLQQSIKNQYRYQRRLLNEVILTIMREAGKRPIIERADSTLLKNCLRSELANNGVDVPFEYAVTNDAGIIQLASGGFPAEGLIQKNDNDYTQALFSSSAPRYYLNVTFPTKSKYIFRSVRFIIPTLAFTAILLVVFLYTIILAFRQKKLTEMKTDFINNMTHEFKTPISTISLASQMLNDDSISKAPALLRHISKVIGEETKRLRILVERVLVLSMFDNAEVSVKLSGADANKLVENVVQTFKIKAEKFGGAVEFTHRAANADVLVDELHFTNVIFSLLDNAVKYKKEDEPPVLKISTTDTTDGKNIEIHIHDNGIGIRKDDIKHIFERFYRVSTGNRHDVKGFGIGLAYVKQIINAFGGSIRVESEYGKWTEFIIMLPLIDNN